MLELDYLSEHERCLNNHVVPVEVTKTTQLTPYEPALSAQLEAAFAEHKDKMVVSVGGTAGAAWLVKKTRKGWVQASSYACSPSCVP